MSAESEDFSITSNIKIFENSGSDKGNSVTF